MLGRKVRDRVRVRVRVKVRGCGSEKVERGFGCNIHNDPSII